MGHTTSWGPLVTYSAEFYCEGLQEQSGIAWISLQPTLHYYKSINAIFYCESFFSCEHCTVLPKCIYLFNTKWMTKKKKHMRIDHEYSTNKTNMVHVAGLVCIRFVGCSTDLCLLPGGCMGRNSNICHWMIFYLMISKQLLVGLFVCDFFLHDFALTRPENLNHFSNLHDNVWFNVTWHRHYMTTFSLTQRGKHDPWSLLSCAGG